MDIQCCGVERCVSVPSLQLMMFQSTLFQFSDENCRHDVFERCCEYFHLCDDFWSKYLIVPFLRPTSHSAP
jgi:hypothetical protein